MNKIDQDPLETLERLLKEAGKEEWRQHLTDETVVVRQDGKQIAAVLGNYETNYAAMNARAALIAHLRNLAPALLEEVRTSRARIESLSAEVERWKNNADSERLRADEAEARVRALEEALRTIFDDPSNFLCDKAEQVCRAALGEHND